MEPSASIWSVALTGNSSVEIRIEKGASAKSPFHVLALRIAGGEDATSYCSAEQMRELANMFTAVADRLEK